MIRINEKKLFKLFMCLYIFSLIISILLGIYSVTKVYEDNTIGKNFFEVIYLGIHFIINFFIASINFLAIKNSSSILSSLKNNFSEKIMKIVSYVFLVINALIFLYFLLVLLGINLYCFHFSIVLIVDVFLGALLIVICSLEVILYLNASKKDDMFISKSNGGF